MNDLNDNVALVTGAARRLGAAIARGVHAQGAKVAPLNRSGDKEAALEVELNAVHKEVDQIRFITASFIKKMPTREG